jgi:hypothetical protein
MSMGLTQLRQKNSLSAAHAEIHARVASVLGMVHVLIETESQNLVNAEHRLRHSTERQHLQEPTPLFMSMYFKSFEFTFALRTSNSLAHQLAAGKTLRTSFTVLPAFRK